MPTMKDLAKVVHYSLSTISKAFYPNTDIAYSTRQAIVRKAIEMGYVHKKYHDALNKAVLLIIDKLFLLKQGINYDEFCMHFVTICLQNNCSCTIVDFQENQTFRNPFFLQGYDGVLWVRTKGGYRVSLGYPLLSFTLEQTSTINFNLDYCIDELRKIIDEKKLVKLVMICNKTYESFYMILKEKIRDVIQVETIEKMEYIQANSQETGYICFSKEEYDKNKKKLNLLYLNFSIEKFAKCVFYSLFQLMNDIPLGKIVFTPQIHF